MASTNGVGTTNGATAAAIAANAINGSDTVSLGIALTTTGTNEGIKTTSVEDKHTVTVTETGSITTGTGNNAYGIYNDGAFNTTTVSGSIKTTGNMHTAFGTMATTTRPPSLAALRQG